MIFCTLLDATVGPFIGFINYLLGLVGLESIQPLAFIYDIFAC